MDAGGGDESTTCYVKYAELLFSATVRMEYILLQCNDDTMKTSDNHTAQPQALKGEKKKKPFIHSCNYPIPL
jgi:hypothetical protein